MLAVAVAPTPRLDDDKLCRAPTPALGVVVSLGEEGPTSPGRGVPRESLTLEGTVSAAVVISRTRDTTISARLGAVPSGEDCASRESSRFRASLMFFSKEG